MTNERLLSGSHDGSTIVDTLSLGLCQFLAQLQPFPAHPLLFSPRLLQQLFVGLLLLLSLQRLLLLCLVQEDICSKFIKKNVKMSCFSILVIFIHIINVHSHHIPNDPKPLKRPQKLAKAHRVQRAKVLR